MLRESFALLPIFLWTYRAHVLHISLPNYKPSSAQPVRALTAEQVRSPAFAFLCPPAVGPRTFCPRPPNLSRFFSLLSPRLSGGGPSCNTSSCPPPAASPRPSYSETSPRRSAHRYCRSPRPAAKLDRQTSSRLEGQAEIQTCVHAPLRVSVFFFFFPFFSEYADGNMNPSMEPSIPTCILESMKPNIPQPNQIHPMPPFRSPGQGPRPVRSHQLMASWFNLCSHISLFYLF